MPVNFTQQERQALLNSLGTGRRSALGAVALCNMIGFPTKGNQIQLRRLIKECIEVDSDLICAATGRPAGFFMVSNVAEFNSYIDSLENRTRSDNDRRSALIRSWNAVNISQPTSRNILSII